MKKAILIMLPALMLVACTTQVPEAYNTIEYTSYNLNPEASELIMSNNITPASIRLTELSNSYLIKDGNSDFSIELANDGLTGKITFANGDNNDWETSKNNYSIIKKNIGDTLVISYLPTEQTPIGILKYGAEYKFYNK